MLKRKAIPGAACAGYGVEKKDYCKGRPGREM